MKQYEEAKQWYANKINTTVEEFDEFDVFVANVAGEYAEQQVKNCNALAVSVAKHPLPRPLEAWKKARELSLSDYINWHMTKEAWK